MYLKGLSLNAYVGIFLVDFFITNMYNTLQLLNYVTQFDITVLPWSLSTLPNQQNTEMLIKMRK